MTQPKRIAVIPGDGIGVDVTREAVSVIGAAAAKHNLLLDLDELPYGSEYYLRTGIGLPREERLRIGREYDGILLGAVGDPRVPDNRTAREIVLGLRFDLDLYINLRPILLIADELTSLKGKAVQDIQFVIFRENTEGSYGGIGGQQHAGTTSEIALGQIVATWRGTHRIVRAAFEYAQKHGLSRVCVVHKQNAIPHVYGLWLRVFRQVAQDYPTIESSEMLVDRAAMEIIRAPEQFQVIVTSNLFGDILSDLAAMIAGGLGLAASANINPETLVLCEPVHGSAPDIAGKGIANPLAACLSGALLLDNLGFPAAAVTIDQAVRAAIFSGCVTPDLGGTKTTRQVGAFVAEHVAKSSTDPSST